MLVSRSFLFPPIYKLTFFTQAQHPHTRLLFQSHRIHTMAAEATITTTTSNTAAKVAGMDFPTKKAYTPPHWASHINHIPSYTFPLGHFPTPIHKWNLPKLPPNTEVWLKRDDLSGMQLSGNKVRKLEFLMADAVEKGADCIVTIGSIQSNHCRATAVAAKYLNLDCYLVLRTSKVLVDQDPGLTGNLLVERLVTTSEEINFVKEIAATTGIVLDPVYSGKAAYGMMKDMAENPNKWEGRKVLFIHTGGLLGLDDKVEQMAPLLGNWSRMDVNESVPRIDGIRKMF